MFSQTIDEVFETLPDQAKKKQLHRVVQAWKSESGSAVDLLLSVRDILTDLPIPLLFEPWHNFEDMVRRHSCVATPFELSRMFGLEEEFDASKYYDRKSMANRLRVDCDYPEAERRARDEKARLATMTPQQRQHFELHQAQRWEEEQKRMQQMMMPQQDAFVSAIQAEIRAGKPRKMLDRESLENLRDTARSRGIDLRSEEPLTIEAEDVEQAIKFARLLSHERNCDLFRGQRKDWNPVPSILRLPLEQQLSSSRWQRFRDWALKQKPLAEIAQNQKELGALGQHYGLPTYLLDFSKNPRVAAFFATHTDIPPDDGKACIYCVWSGALEASYHHAPAYMRYYEIFPTSERVEVDGLFRMHAQEGAFVYANQTWWTSVFQPDIIRFPRTREIAIPAPSDIYPSRMSEIEHVIFDYFENEPEQLKNSV
jgi:hypothetical protein